MGIIEIARDLGIDLKEFKITKSGLKPVEPKTVRVGNKRIPLGCGRYKYTNNPNAQKSGGGESGSQGNGTRVDGN